EVVGREKGEVAAEIAEAADNVVLVLRHVLLVTREDDEVVVSRELVAALYRRKVVVGEKVHVLPGLVQPGDELEVPVVEAKRDAEVEKRTVEIDAPAASDVPRVAPPVTVRVLEVVRRPGVRREYDGDAVSAEPAGADDEGRGTDASVRRRRAHEEEPARPVAGANDPQKTRRLRLPAPVDRDRAGHREPGGADVLLARPSRRLIGEYL